MKYDDSSWHSEGDFPADLSPDAGATHLGMFLTWALFRGLASDALQQDCQEEVKALRDRQLTPGQFIQRCCDGTLGDEELNAEGRAFAADYLKIGESRYARDYVEAIDVTLPTAYHAPDDWGSYELLAPVLDQRLAEWRAGQ